MWERIQGPASGISVMLSHGGADSISTLDVASDVVLLKLRLYFVLRILNGLNRYERRKRDVPNVNDSVESESWQCNNVS